MLNVVQRVAIWILPVLFAITVHEVAHGWVARRLGDPTAMMLGRLTLNPLKHIDPVGTVLVPCLTLLAGGVIFGWAKPVPVTWGNLKRPKRDMAVVAIAGPAANLLMAVVWALVVRVGVLYYESFAWLATPLIFMGVAGIFINTILMVLNMLPLPPLDGGRVLVGLLPGRWSWKLSRIEPYGLIILLVLLISRVLWELLGPPILLFMTLLSSVTGVHPNEFQTVLNALLHP